VLKKKEVPSKTKESLKVLLKLKYGLLSEHGYHLNENSTKRKIAIRKAILLEGILPVYSKLVFLKTYRKNEKGLIYNRLSSDVNYSKEFFEKNKFVKYNSLKIKPILKKRKSEVGKRKKIVRFCI
jgi:hypothetical protein